ncbi:hypothetical protein Trydic_g6908 [Trypoxylus dichotomus]
MEDPERTIFCGNLSTKVTEELLYELFLQAAPLEKVKIPTDKEGRAACYAFITFKHKISVPYAVDLMQGIALYQKKLILKPRSTAGQVLQENDRQHTTITQKSNNLNEMILSGQMLANNMNSKRFDISPVSRRERGFNHGYDRRNDKPYGQVFRNRNNRFDFDSRTNHTNSHYRRH